MAHDNMTVHDFSKSPYSFEKKPLVKDLHNEYSIRFTGDIDPFIFKAIQDSSFGITQSANSLDNAIIQSFQSDKFYIYALQNNPYIRNNIALEITSTSSSTIHKSSYFQYILTKEKHPPSDRLPIIQKFVQVSAMGEKMLLQIYSKNTPYAGESTVEYKARKIILWEFIDYVRENFDCLFKLEKLHKPNITPLY